MRPLPFLLPLFAPVMLAACSPSAARVQRMLDIANRCETADDCVLIGSRCPFGCSIYVHKSEAELLKTVVDGFQSDCVYGCMQAFGVECREHTCKAITEPNANIAIEPPAAAAERKLTEEGNPGAACRSSDECNTPVRFLLRSNCPFDSRCIDDRCAVVCPMPSPETSVGWTKPAACTADADCDCGAYVAQDRTSCRCVDGACMAVVEE